MAGCIIRDQGAASLGLAPTPLWIVQLSHDNGRDLTTVIRLFSLRCAPVREEKRFVCVRAACLVNDVGYASGLQAAENISRQIEMRFGGRSGHGKKRSACWIAFEDAGFELGADFIGRLADARPECGGNARPLCTDAFHLGQCALDDTADCAAPTGVRRGDDFGFGIGKQQRSAVGRQDADDEPGVPCS